MKPSLLLLAVFLLLWTVPLHAASEDSPIDLLQQWLADSQRPDIRQQPFASTSLSKKQAEHATQILWDDYLARIKFQRSGEWNDKVITIGKHRMKFDYRTFGNKPQGGRSLFISMHGGGGAPARVNDQQWRNQIRLYEPEEGIYLAPRAPTDSWNLWHQAHIDILFERIIQDAIAFADVNPDRVYLMGYSAGGDGVYQLAPRMADRIAAAAMMAGHPNDASPLGLRNIGFTLHMGGDDGAYNRNKVAAEWKEKLAKLKKADPTGYRHEVVIHAGLGHWMQKKDAVAVPWMAKFTRNPYPDKVVWHQSSVTHQQFYWLAVPEQDAAAGTAIIVVRDGNVFTIERAEKVKRIRFLLNDQLADLDQPVEIRFADRQLYRGRLQRHVKILAKSISDRGDPHYAFSAQVDVDLN